jgi:DNA polymerase-3 subunit beta
LGIEANGDKTKIVSGKSKFMLSSLPAKEFPSLEVSSPQVKFDLNEEKLKDLIKKTAFSMAHQDVRYYLNGMLIEISKNEVKGIATDGHRLAMCTKKIDASFEGYNSLLVPRKAVSELDRLLERGDKKVNVQLFSNVARFSIDETSLTTKLIDGKFPDYSRVIPTLCEKKAVIDKESFRNALVRTSILSSDRYKGIRVSLEKGWLKIQAHNPEQEEAEEEMEVEYEEDFMTIGFNVGYLLDILATMDSERILLEFSTTSKSSIIKALDCSDCLYVVMPMRL